MALQKSITLSTGLDAEYWKVTTCNLDVNSLNLFCVLSLYKDASYRATPEAVCLVIDFMFNITDLEANGNLRSLSYDKIKATSEPRIAGSVDV